MRAAVEASSLLSHVNLCIEALQCRAVGRRLQLPAALSPLFHTSSLMNLFCLSAAVGPIIRLKSPGPLGAPESDPAAADRRKIETQNTISRAQMDEVSLTTHSLLILSLIFLLFFPPPVLTSFLLSVSFFLCFTFVAFCSFFPSLILPFVAFSFLFISLNDQ